MAVDSHKYNWPTMHGREDYRAKVKLWEDAGPSAQADGTVPYDTTDFASFVAAMHNDDDTTATSLPFAEVDTVEHVSGTTHELVVTFSATHTTTAQDSGYTRLRIDLFGVGPAAAGGERTPLIKGVTNLYRTVPVTF